MLADKTRDVSPNFRRIRIISSLTHHILLGALILTWSSILMHGQAAATAASKEELFQRVVSAVQKGDFEGALHSSAIALRSDPNDHRLWTLSGMAYSGLRQHTPAQAAFEHALKIAPYYLPALEGEAQLQYQLGSENARPYLLRILALRPSDPTTHAMLAVLDYRKKDCPAAVPHFQQAGDSISSQPDGLTMYGKCLANSSRFEEAIPILEHATSLDSTKHSARYYLALCEWNVDRNADALANLKALMAAGASDPKVLELAAGVYESMGESQNAIDLLRQAIITNPKNPDAYLQFAELTYEHGSPKIGIDFLNAGLTQLPREARLYLVRGMLLCQLGEFTEAFEDFETANRYDPALSYVDVAKGIVESQSYKPNEALTQFRAAALEHPDDALTQYLLAETASQGEVPNDAEAMAAVTRAVQLDPKLVAAQDLLAGLYLQHGDKQRAITHSEAALATDPNDQQALYHLTLAMRGTERKGEIPALIKRLSELKQAERKGNSPQKRLHQLYESPDVP